MTDLEMDELVSDLLTSSEHCPTRDVVAAGLISNLRQKTRDLRASAEHTPRREHLTHPVNAARLSVPDRALVEAMSPPVPDLVKEAELARFNEWIDEAFPSTPGTDQ